MLARSISQAVHELTCLSYIPLLLLPLPLSLSPVHLTIFFLLTYFLNRPCIYCSLLLVILFASSCHWSGRCFLELNYTSVQEGGLGYADWFTPAIYTQGGSNITEASFAEYVGQAINGTVAAMAGATFQEVKRKLTRSPGGLEPILSSGIGLHWARRLLGGRMGGWSILCLGTVIRL